MGVWSVVHVIRSTVSARTHETTRRPSRQTTPCAGSRCRKRPLEGSGGTFVDDVIRQKRLQPRNHGAPWVGKGGVEPPRPYGHTDLNRARLPFRHLPAAREFPRAPAAAVRKASTQRCHLRWAQVPPGRAQVPSFERAERPRRVVVPWRAPRTADDDGPESWAATPSRRAAMGQRSDRATRLGEHGAQTQPATKRGRT